MKSVIQILIRPLSPPFRPPRQWHHLRMRSWRTKTLQLAFYFHDYCTPLNFKSFSLEAFRSFPWSKKWFINENTLKVVARSISDGSDSLPSSFSAYFTTPRAVSLPRPSENILRKSMCTTHTDAAQHFSTLWWHFHNITVNLSRCFFPAQHKSQRTELEERKIMNHWPSSAGSASSAAGVVTTSPSIQVNIYRFTTFYHPRQRHSW